LTVDYCDVTSTDLAYWSFSNAACGHDDVCGTRTDTQTDITELSILNPTPWQLYYGTKPTPLDSNWPRGRADTGSWLASWPFGQLL